MPPCTARPAPGSCRGQKCARRALVVYFCAPPAGVGGPVALQELVVDCFHVEDVDKAHDDVPDTLCNHSPLVWNWNTRELAVGYLAVRTFVSVAAAWRRRGGGAAVAWRSPPPPPLFLDLLPFLLLAQFRPNWSSAPSHTRARNPSTITAQPTCHPLPPAHERAVPDQHAH